MIFLRFLSSGLLKVFELILSMLPSVTIPVLEVSTTVIQIINLLNYILPMDTIGTIFALTVLITGFRFVLAIISRIFDVLNVIF